MERTPNTLRKALTDWLRRAHVEALIDADERLNNVRLQCLRRAAWRANAPWLAWAVVVLLGAFIARGKAGPWLPWVTLGLLVPPLLVFGVRRLRDLLQLDELQQRIELLAMSVTFVVATTWLVAWVVIESLHVPLHGSAVLTFMLFYGTYTLSRRYLQRRYR